MIESVRVFGVENASFRSPEMAEPVADHVPKHSIPRYFGLVVSGIGLGFILGYLLYFSWLKML
jgi:hypothetical protein